MSFFLPFLPFLYYIFTFPLYIFLTFSFFSNNFFLFLSNFHSPYPLYLVFLTLFPFTFSHFPPPSFFYHFYLHFFHTFTSGSRLSAQLFSPSHFLSSFPPLSLCFLPCLSRLLPQASFPHSLLSPPLYPASNPLSKVFSVKSVSTLLSCLPRPASRRPNEAILPPSPTPPLK